MVSKIVFPPSEIWAKSDRLFPLIFLTIYGGFLGISIYFIDVAQASLFDLFGLLVLAPIGIRMTLSAQDAWKQLYRKWGIVHLVLGSLLMFQSLSSACRVGINSEALASIYGAWLIVTVVRILGFEVGELAKKYDQHNE